MSECRQLASIIDNCMPTLIRLFHVAKARPTVVSRLGPTADHSPDSRAEADHVTSGVCSNGSGFGALFISNIILDKLGRQHTRICRGDMINLQIGVMDAYASDTSDIMVVLPLLLLLLLPPH